MSDSLSIDLATITSLCKRRGFIFQSSEIYGGIESIWDYGPLGGELKNNIRQHWWNHMVWKRSDMVGLDSSIIMHPNTWETSGHISNFNDPLIECSSCNKRWRNDELEKLICPSCNNQLDEPKMFNLMFKTQMGPITETSSEIYLRPETAQGIFVNFDNVLKSSRKKIPFGIAQAGKAFRNEITTRNFIFRTREFEIMELEYFVNPSDAEEWFNYWNTESLKWIQSLGIDESNLRIRQHQDSELAHYSKATSDIEYKFPWGWGEVAGIANRTDYDLKSHSAATNSNLSYFNESEKTHITPYVIEPTFGLDRIIFMLLVDAYTSEEVSTSTNKIEQRVLLKLNPIITPIKIAILPLSRKESLIEIAQGIYNDLVSSNTIVGRIEYDDTQSIGKRYRRQAEIGTPLCITIDFQSLEDETVTIRTRDSMDQIRSPINSLVTNIQEKLTI